MNKTINKIIELVEYLRSHKCQSIRQISKDMKMNWRTVANYLDLFDRLNVNYRFRSYKNERKNNK